jgi:hypothetical protein
MPNGKVIDILAQVRNVFILSVFCSKEYPLIKQIIYEYSHPPNYRV